MLSLREQTKQFDNKYRGREVVFTNTYYKIVPADSEWKNKNYIVGTVEGRDNGLIKIKLSATYKTILNNGQGDVELYYLHEIAVVPTKNEIIELIKNLEL